MYVLQEDKGLFIRRNRETCRNIEKMIKLLLLHCLPLAGLFKNGRFQEREDFLTASSFFLPSLCVYTPEFNKRSSKELKNSFLPFLFFQFWSWNGFRNSTFLLLKGPRDLSFSARRNRPQTDRTNSVTHFKVSLRQRRPVNIRHKGANTFRLKFLRSLYTGAVERASRVPNGTQTWG